MFKLSLFMLFILMENIFGIMKVIMMVKIKSLELWCVLWILNFCCLYFKLLIKNDKFVISSRFFSIELVKEVSMILVNFFFNVKIEMISLIVFLKVVFNKLLICGFVIMDSDFVVFFI